MHADLPFARSFAHASAARRCLVSTLLLLAALVLAAAVEHTALHEANLLRARIDGLSRRRRGAESIAELLVELLVDDTDGSEELVSRYERYIACARQPALRDIQRRVLRQRTDAVGEAVERSGRCVRSDLLSALVCAVDGAVVSALVDDGGTPRDSARATLIDVIDVFAPIDQRALHV